MTKRKGDNEKNNEEIEKIKKKKIATLRRDITFFKVIITPTLNSYFCMIKIEATIPPRRTSSLPPPPYSFFAILSSIFFVQYLKKKKKNAKKNLLPNCLSWPSETP